MESKGSIMGGAISWCEKTVSRYAVLRFLMGFTPMMCCYGIFLFLYEICFLRELVPAVHPVLIAWAVLVAAYSILIRQDWRRIPRWGLLLAFLVFAGVTAVANMGSTGLVPNVKALIMTAIPVAAFLPYCASVPKADAKKKLLAVLLGPAVIMLVCSLTALIMYLLRFYEVVVLAGIRYGIGLSVFEHWLTGDPVSLLYGVYTDTNHAALYAIATMLYSGALYAACKKGICARKGWNKAGRIFAVVNIVVQASYFPLANSRGGWLSIGIVAAVLAFFCIAFGNTDGKTDRKKVLLGLIGAVLAAVLCVGVLIGWRTCWSAASQAVATIQQSSSMGKPSDNGDPDSPQETLPEIPLDQFNKNDTTGSGRMEIWKDAMKLYTHRPILGHNPGNTVHYAKLYLPGSKLARGTDYHNSYIDLLLDYGVIGFLLMMAYWVCCVVIAVRKVIQGKCRGLGEYCVLGIAVLVACGSAFLSCVFINTTAMYFLLMVAVGYLVTERKDECNAS